MFDTFVMFVMFVYLRSLMPAYIGTNGRRRVYNRTKGLR